MITITLRQNVNSVGRDIYALLYRCLTQVPPDHLSIYSRPAYICRCSAKTSTGMCCYMPAYLLNRIHQSLRMCIGVTFKVGYDVTTSVTTSHKLDIRTWECVGCDVRHCEHCAFCSGKRDARLYYRECIWRHSHVALVHISYAEGDCIQITGASACILYEYIDTINMV